MFLLGKTSIERKYFFLVLDVIFITLSFYLAFFLRFDYNIPGEYFSKTLPAMIVVSIFFCLFIFNYFKLYSFSWSYVGTVEMVSLFQGVFFSFLFTTVSLMLLQEIKFLASFPRSVVIISFFLIFIFCGASRLGKRVFFMIVNKKKSGIRVLIVGAGDAGEQVLRNIKTSKNNYFPIGFADDEPSKKEVSIHGLPVLGKIEDIEDIIVDNNIEELIIALPSAGKEIIKEAVERGRKAGLKEIKIIPGISDIISGEISLGNLREVSVEDLLGREQAHIDTKAISEFIKGKTILITGAAGSIGSELSRQIAKFMPKKLVLLDQDETGIFCISNEIKSAIKKNGIPIEIVEFVADICDEKKMENIFESVKPEIVFHAAAYKHVPLMEEHFDEAIKNNIFGLKFVVESAIKNKVEKFVFISTDKAVNPTSIMGATKRIGEMLCQLLGDKSSTKFISVRFGNVLDSRGSVIPIFRDRIKRREALEITHPEMKRYFMMIPEACLLVMQSAEMGNGGEVFVLDMGNPVKIADLAKTMIELAGLEADKDIPIVYVGIRPGEKLFEEILTAEEGTSATQNQSIFKANLEKITNEELFNNSLTLLRDAGEKKDRNKAEEVFKGIIPFYKNIDKE